MSQPSTSTSAPAIKCGRCDSADTSAEGLMPHLKHECVPTAAWLEAARNDRKCSHARCRVTAGVRS